MGLTVGLRVLGVLGSGFRVWGLGFRVQGRFAEEDLGVFLVFVFEAPDWGKHSFGSLGGYLLQSLHGTQIAHVYIGQEGSIQGCLGGCSYAHLRQRNCFAKLLGGKHQEAI